MLDHQALTLLVAVGTLVLTALLYVVIPKGFFPVQDTGLIQVITEGPQSVSYEAMAERQQALAAEILKDPAVESLSSFVGVDGTNTTLNTGRMLVNLKPKADRSDTAEAVIQRLNGSLSKVEGITAYMQPVQDLTIDDRVSRTQYQFVLKSANPDDLTKWVPQLTTQLGQLSQLSDVASDLSDSGLGAYIDIDRDTAARFGITAATIDNALYDAFGQRIISTIFTESNQYRVIMEADPALQRSPDSLAQIYVPSASGGQVPLSAIAKFEERPEPLLINHLSQFPANTISFNVPRGGSLGNAVKAIRAVEAEDRDAREHHHELPGRGGRLRELALQRALPDRGGDPDDVHHPGDPLRELHPPDHDPLDAAVGRDRRAPRPHGWSAATSASSASSASSS